MRHARVLEAIQRRAGRRTGTERRRGEATLVPAVCRGPGGHGTVVHRGHQQPQLLRVSVPRFSLLYWTILWYYSVTGYKTVGAHALSTPSLFSIFDR